MTPFEWVAIALVSIISTGRITRLFTWDEMPFFLWLRMKWDDLTEESTWNKLLHCQYCASVWIAPAVVLPGYFTDWHLAWWLFHGTMSVAYLGAVTMAYDGED